MPTKNPQEPFTRLTVREAEAMLRAGEVQLIDVREPREYNSGHLPGARHIPLNAILRRVAELDDTKPILFVCSDRQRSALAAEYAAAAGKTDLYTMDGGTEGWEMAGLPLEK